MIFFGGEGVFVFWFIYIDVIFTPTPITFKKYNPNATYNVDLFYTDYSIDLHVKKYEQRQYFILVLNKDKLMKKIVTNKVRQSCKLLTLQNFIN